MRWTTVTSRNADVQVDEDSIILNLIEYPPFGYKAFPLEELQEAFPACWVYDVQHSVIPYIEIVPKHGKVTPELIQKVKEFTVDVEKLRRRVRDALNKTTDRAAIIECAKVLNVKIS